MIIDKNLVLTENVNFFGNAGSAIRGDVIDLKESGLINWGGMNPLYWVILITTAAAGGSTTYDFQLKNGQGLTSGNLTTGAGNVARTGPIGVGFLTKGRRLLVPYYGSDGRGGADRYLQAAVTRVGTSTAGKFTSFITMNPQDWQATKAAEVQLT